MLERSTGIPVASAMICSHRSERDPPPMVTSSSTRLPVERMAAKPMAQIQRYALHLRPIEMGAAVLVAEADDAAARVDIPIGCHAAAPVRLQQQAARADRQRRRLGFQPRVVVGRTMPLTNQSVRNVPVRRHSS